MEEPVTSKRIAQSLLYLNQEAFRPKRLKRGDAVHVTDKEGNVWRLLIDDIQPIALYGQTLNGRAVRVE